MRRKVAITGAGGLVGGELARQLAAGHEVLALRRGDLEITDAGAVRHLILSERPSIVINCAVLNVDDCERRPALARAVNVEGPRALAEAAAEVGADLLHFSTNYVFDGERPGRPPYTVEDEPRPINVYGRTKLEGERAVLAAAPPSFIVRTSWVFGPGKQNFLSAAHRRQLAGESIKALADVWANATYVADLAARTGEILARRRSGTYQVVNGGVCSYHEFAVEAARLAGVEAEEARRLIEAASESGMRRAAPRPRYTPMRCLLSEELGLEPLRGWRAALADYIRADLGAGTPPQAGGE